MVETVTFSELEENLEFIPPEVAVLLVGPAGIGKSSFAKAWVHARKGIAITRRMSRKSLT